jgi:hypothetical protein
MDRMTHESPARDEVELLPCPNPWCYGDRLSVRWTSTVFKAHCNCGMAGPAGDTEAEAITAWNTRLTTAPQGIPDVVSWLNLAADQLKKMADDFKIGMDDPLGRAEWFGIHSAYEAVYDLAQKAEVATPTPPAQSSEYTRGRAAGIEEAAQAAYVWWDGEPEDAEDLRIHLRALSAPTPVVEDASHD